MGKYSNIIFTDENDKILESIKHISGLVSSVREVLPGYDYFVPKQEDKLNPLMADENEFERYDVNNHQHWSMKRYADELSKSLYEIHDSSKTAYIRFRTYNDDIEYVIDLRNNDKFIARREGRNIGTCHTVYDNYEEFRKSIVSHYKWE